MELEHRIARAMHESSEVRHEAVRGAQASEFEVDFEIRYALFLSANIDGSYGSAERRFMDAVSLRLGWSAFYAGLLQKRIDALPSYELDSLAIGCRCGPFGRFLYRLALAMASVDGVPNQNETFFLDSLGRHLFKEASPALRATVHEDSVAALDAASSPASLLASPPAAGVSGEVAPEDPPSVEDCLAELDALIGLGGVKREVKKLISFLEIQKERERLQLVTPRLSLHMVFSGNPGTGKTTVARLVARIFRALGILEKGHLVETDRSGLVGQYVGHTERKTSEVIDQALGGILFIDEAYSLSKDSENDFGKEAIDTLVKRMEDDRSRLVVIAAGYEKEIGAFIASNPGLQSRFSTYIRFGDYSADELLSIFKILCEANEYELSSAAEERLRTLFAKELDAARQGFGNGRYARNLFEMALRNQAMRLSGGDALTRKDLMTLQPQDFPVETA